MILIYWESTGKTKKFNLAVEYHCCWLAVESDKNTNVEIPKELKCNV